MKPYIIIICLILIISFTASAQDNKTDIKQTANLYTGRRALALVVVTHKEEYLTDTIGIKLLKQQGILKMDNIGDDIDPGPNDTSKYGNNASNGIIRFIIDDKKYPKAYYHIVKTMHYIGPATPAKH